MNETEIDNTIGQVERLYRSLTGLDAPPVREEAYATIPPEKVPEEHVQEQVDRLVEELTQFSGRTTFEGWKPSISIWDGKDEVVISVDLPGVSRDGIRVSVARGMLEVQGSRPDQTGQDGGQVGLRYTEHALGKFRRMIPLPPDTSPDQIQAQLRSGVLEIRARRGAPPHEVKIIHVG